MLLPQHVTAGLVKQEAGVAADLVLVRDLGSPNDVAFEDDAKLDLAQGNAFYTLLRCEVKPSNGCDVPPKLVFVIDDRSEETLNPKPTGRSLRELFGFAPAVRLFRDYQSPDDIAIGLDAEVIFSDGPVFYTRRANNGLHHR